MTTMAQRSVREVASARRLEVDPERIARWVNGFAERHGEFEGLADLLNLSPPARAVLLSAADGATALLEPFGLGAIGGTSGAHSPPRPDGQVGLDGPVGPDGPVGADGPVGLDARRRPGSSGGPDGAVDLEALAGWAEPPTRLGLIVVRRGGYAVGVGQGPELVGHKVGTRYVQSRTAAGGWSQQRFARRRANQADALVSSVVEHTRRVVLAAPTDALVVGGDKSLVRDVLADSRLGDLARLPRRELFDLPDPKLVVLKQALRRGRAVRILLSEPADTAGQP